MQRLSYNTLSRGRPLFPRKTLQAPPGPFGALPAAPLDQQERYADRWSHVLDVPGYQDLLGRGRAVAAARGERPQVRQRARRHAGACNGVVGHA